MDEADAFTGHDDAGPAYCEVYNHAPVLAIRLQNADQLVAQTPELELVQWAHRIERTLEAALAEQQAFKPPCRSQGTCHVFCLNPELSARQQANTLLLSAHKLQQLLPTVSRQQLARRVANTQPNQHDHCLVRLAPSLAKHTLSSTTSSPHRGSTASHDGCIPIITTTIRHHVPEETHGHTCYRSHTQAY
jgi:hypothetical protein